MTLGKYKNVEMLPKKQTEQAVWLYSVCSDTFEMEMLIFSNVCRWCTYLKNTFKWHLFLISSPVLVNECFFFWSEMSLWDIPTSRVLSKGLTKQGRVVLNLLTFIKKMHLQSNWINLIKQTFLCTRVRILARPLGKLAALILTPCCRLSWLPAL